jgi:hypothetical protein
MPSTTSPSSKPVAEPSHGAFTLRVQYETGVVTRTATIGRRTAK